MISRLAVTSFLLLLLLLLLPRTAFSQESEAVAEKDPVSDEATASFYVIPIQGAIGPPTLFAIRNGLKEAIENDFDAVALNMDTPGGRLDTTLEIMEALDRFPGKTITFVNDEATSAGAIIAAVTDEIYFTPRATMGSAEPVTGTGEDINESMKRKLMSYMNAKMDAYTDEYSFRSEVIRAMMDPNFEFKIGDEIISPEGEILNLNAKAAHEEYGDPPKPLLGSGIVEDLDSLLERLAGERELRVQRFEPTWSLNLAQLIVSLAPILIAIATISIYIEFQTPGFGVFGILGVACFLVAMFGHHVAGLSGQEPMLLFALGVLLLVLEVVVAPGSLIFAIPGALVILGSILWSMIDVWPEEAQDFAWDWSVLERPLQNLVGGALLGILLIVIIARFLPRSLVWDRLVLKEAMVGNAQEAPRAEGTATVVTGPEAGAEGVARTDLMPGGEVEIAGRRYEARLMFGSAPRGARVRVLRKADFGYIVEEIES